LLYKANRKPYIEMVSVHLSTTYYQCLNISTGFNAENKQQESFEMWCWRRMEKISWTDCVKTKYYTGSRRTGISYMP
jgi:hypothetical protein